MQISILYSIIGVAEKYIRDFGMPPVTVLLHKDTFAKIVEAFRGYVIFSYQTRDGFGTSQLKLSLSDDIGEGMIKAVGYEIS